MKMHLLAIESGGLQGRQLQPTELTGVLKSIKALGSRAKAQPRNDLRGKTIGQMLEEASKHPDVARAIAAMGG